VATTPIEVSEGEPSSSLPSPDSLEGASSHRGREFPRLIVLNGFRRGGTSIVWNILESHPQVSSPLSETGQIIYADVLPWLPETPTKLIVRSVLRNRRLRKSPLGARFDREIRESLRKRRLRNLEDPETRFGYDGVPYTASEIESTVLCLKSVNWDGCLTEYFHTCYPETTFIGLMRNGYAICNGMMRRGDTAERAGKIYRRVGERMIEDERKYPRYRVVKFEDVLRDPFAAASELYRFSGLSPVHLDKLRLKSKRVLSRSGDHETRFGEEDRRYWLDRTQIRKVLDSDVNEVQAGFLTPRERQAFEKYARPVLDHFQYSWEP
jgi:Sulfotransferase family